MDIDEKELATEARKAAELEHRRARAAELDGDFDAAMKHRRKAAEHRATARKYEVK